LKHFLNSEYISENILKIHKHLVIETPEFKRTSLNNFSSPQDLIDIIRVENDGWWNNEQKALFYFKGALMYKMNCPLKLNYKNYADKDFNIEVL